MRWLTCAATLLMGSVFSVASAAEYKAEALKQGPPKDALSKELADQLSSSGVRVLAGKKTLCEIWLRKQWPVKAGFKPSATVLYPFEVGEFVGVVHFPSQASDEGEWPKALKEKKLWQCMLTAPTWGGGGEASCSSREIRESRAAARTAGSKELRSSSSLVISSA